MCCKDVKVFLAKNISIFSCLLMIFSTSVWYLGTIAIQGLITAV